MKKPSKPSFPKKISVGARSSPLSQAQLNEVLNELQTHHPHVEFQPQYVLSTGDKNLHISLRTLDKTDFFTKEVDEMVLNRQCRVGIHSAKDLPEPLPQGLYLAALTRGVDPSDSLVVKPGMTLENLPTQALIATSSERREEAVRQLRQDLTFTDIRGTIGQRLAKLENGEVDGVVIAEAALIRLGLNGLNRIKIPGETVPFQGQLAIITRKDDCEMRELFSCIDCRRKTLYLGLTPPNQELIHYPIIKIVPRPHAEILSPFQHLHLCTHLIFTSKTAVNIFFDCLARNGVNLNGISIFAVGHATAQCIESKGYPVAVSAKDESAEGIIKELDKVDLSQAYVFWPHSALSRPLIKEYLLRQNVKLCAWELYDTMPNLPLPKPDLSKVEEIVFTSPSCVDAFVQFFGLIPSTKKLMAIGPVTEAYLKNLVVQVDQHNRS